MSIRIVVPLLALLASGTLNALTVGEFSKYPSQIRGQNESYDAAEKRFQEWWIRYGEAVPLAETALGSAVPFMQFDASRIQEWAPSIEAREIFRQGRDARFLYLPESPGFARRISWLYPDDGCFARAALFGRWMEGSGHGRLQKLFVFGSLRVQTPNSPRGRVSWWYHVVPATRIGGEAWIFDPAIEPRGLLPLVAWLERMSTSPASLKLSVCNPYAYGPGSPCATAGAAQEGAALRDGRIFLSKEWNRLVQLGRNAEAELSDSPPWSARPLPFEFEVEEERAGEGY